MGSDWDYINEHMGGHDEAGLPNFVSRSGFADDSYHEEKSQMILNHFDSFQEAMAWAKSNPGKTITRSPDGNGYIRKII